MKIREIFIGTVTTVFLIVSSWMGAEPPSNEVKIGRAPFTIVEGRGPVRAYSFDVSPDGQEMTFIVDFAGYYDELWSADIDGSHPEKLYEIEEAKETAEQGLPNYEFIWTPKYSPQGDKIVFMRSGIGESREHRGKEALCVFDISSRTVSDVYIADGVGYGGLGWKDNMHLYFTGLDRSTQTRTLYEIGIDGAGLKSIFSGNFNRAYPSPDWGEVCLIYRHVVYMPSTTGGTTHKDHYTVEMLDLSTMKKVEIIGEKHEFKGHHCVWSPDSKFLLFNTSGWKIIKMTPDGNEEKVIGEGESAHCWKKDFILYWKRGAEPNTVFKKIIK